MAESERGAPALAADQPPDLDSLSLEIALERERAAQDLGVEGAGQPAVARERHERHCARLAALEQRQPVYVPDRPRGRGDQLEHTVGVGAHRHDPLLCPPELGGRDQLHRFGDLVRGADRANPSLDVLLGCHDVVGLENQAELLFDVESVLELLQLRLEPGGQLVGEILRLADLLQDRPFAAQLLA